MKKYNLLLTLMIILIGTSYSALGGQEAIQYTGTFSNLYFNKEGGDLLGEELRIVTVRDGYQGIFQIAEGAPSRLMLVDIIIKKNHIYFKIPTEFVPYGGGEFTGTIDSHGIIGLLKFPGGGENKLILPRKKSYWE